MTKVGVSFTIEPETLMKLRDLMRVKKMKKSHLVEAAILKMWKEVEKYD